MGKPDADGTVYRDDQTFRLEIRLGKNKSLEGRAMTQLHAATTQERFVPNLNQTWRIVVPIIAVLNHEAILDRKRLQNCKMQATAFSNKSAANLLANYKSGLSRRKHWQKPSSRPSDGAFRCRGNQCGIFSEDTTGIARRRGFPLGQSISDFRIRKIDIQSPFGDVKNDRIPFPEGGNRSAVSRFRRYMTGHEATRGAAESPVGHQSNGLPQPLANQGAGHTQHFAHAGTTLGAFIANDHHVAGFDGAGGNGFHGVFFPVEDASRPSMMQALITSHFDNAALRR
jgi:hypothetical protein